jgi:hypothetical protein
LSSTAPQHRADILLQVREVGGEAQLHFVQVVVFARHADRAGRHDVHILPLDVQRNVHRRNLEGKLGIVSAQRRTGQGQQKNERDGDDLRQLRVGWNLVRRPDAVKRGFFIR